MKFDSTVHRDHIAHAFKWVIENVLSKVLRNSEVQVSVSIKPKEPKTIEPYSARSVYNPKAHVSE